MSGRIIRAGHTCVQPPPMQYERGTVWQCDCGRYWYRQGFGWTLTNSIEVALLQLADGFAAVQVEARARRQAEARAARELRAEDPS